MQVYKIQRAIFNEYNFIVIHACKKKKELDNSDYISIFTL
jgi:hypothetical protein